MTAFSELLGYVVTGLLIMLMVQYFGAQLAAWVRDAFSFRDPDLGWDPSSGMFRERRRGDVPEIGAGDWVTRFAERQNDG